MTFAELTAQREDQQAMILRLGSACCDVNAAGFNLSEHVAAVAAVIVKARALRTASLGSVATGAQPGDGSTVAFRKPPSSFHGRHA